MEGTAMNGVESGFQIIITALLAVFGALARLLGKKEKIAVKLSNAVSGCFVAAFAGVLAHFTAEYLALDKNLAYILAGICGWAGPQVIDAFAEMVLKKTGIGTEKKEQ
jgi:Na+-translocating ferredoxin:NAD+ oxidoreductase RnfA subunit